VLDGAPALEPAFIAAGRSVRRWHAAAALHWFTTEALITRLRDRPDRYRRMRIGGRDILVDITDHTGHPLYFYGEPYEPELARFVPDVLRPGDVFVDVGANIGFFSVLAGAAIAPTGRIVAFEPDPRARARLASLVAANGVAPAIEVVPAAVGAAAASATFFLAQDPVLSTLVPDESPAPHLEVQDTIEVAVVSLDEWFATRGDLSRRIRLVKIDVEGGESAVVAGMQQLLRDHPAVIVVCETTIGSDADVQLLASGRTRTSLDIRRDAFGNYAYVPS